MRGAWIENLNPFLRRRVVCLVFWSAGSRPSGAHPRGETERFLPRSALSHPKETLAVLPPKFSYMENDITLPRQALDRALNIQRDGDLTQQCHLSFASVGDGGCSPTCGVDANNNPVCCRALAAGYKKVTYDAGDVRFGQVCGTHY